VTKTARSIPEYAAAALLVVGVVLVVWNWRLQPDRAAAWVAALVMFGVMTVAMLVASGRRRQDGTAGRPAVGTAGAVALGALVLVMPLSIELLSALGAFVNHEWSRRAPMAVVGAFFVVTGNAMPKMLKPLSAMRCDPARVQTFQRLAGWTWVLTGLGFAAVWLVLPVNLAQPASLVLLVAGMLTVATQLARLLRRRQAV
jgi:hypothetical protein